MLKILRTVPPTVEPITLALAKQHLRVDDTYSDALIQNVYIPAARDFVETWTGRALMPQTWQRTLNAFPFAQMNNFAYTRRRFVQDFYINKAMAIYLPKAPLQSVVSITYIDGTGTLQTLDPSTYYVDTDSEPGLVLPTTGVFWPYPQAFVSDTIKITYTCGYPLQTVTEVDNVPGTAPFSFALENQNVDAVTSVKYANGTALTLVSNAPTAPGQYAYANGTITVSPADQGVALTVAYTVYAIPPLLTLAMLLLVAQQFENRPLDLTAKNSADKAIQSLLSKYDLGILDYEDLC